MKRLYFLFLLMLSLQSFGQAVSVSADPAVASMFFSAFASAGSSAIPANSLSPGANVFLHLPILNLSANAIPEGTTAKIKIQLGPNAIPNPAFDLSTAPLSTYFNWVSVIVSGQYQIQGTLKIPLPAFFDDEASFAILPTLPTGAAGAAMIGQWTIPNTNPAYNFSDNVPSNNSASLTYNVSASAGPLPVSFKDLRAVKNGCTINMAWSVGNEVNVKNYEIITSKDGGVTWTSVGTKSATGLTNYANSFTLNDQIKAATILVRVRVIDNDGSIKLSDIVSVAGSCDKAPTPWVISAYPNPVTDQSYITLNAKQGVLDGKYSLVILDNAGKTYMVKDVELSNAKTYQLNFGKVMAAGKYVIKLISKDGSQNAVIEFQKL